MLFGILFFLTYRVKEIERLQKLSYFCKRFFKILKKKTPGLECKKNIHPSNGPIWPLLALS